MPHVSSRKIKREDYLKMYGHFMAIVQKSDKKELQYFFGEFFTKTERLMFAKRLAVIYLLSRGVPQSYIASGLAMSPSTIARVSLKKEIGSFDFLLKILKKEHESFLDSLERIVSLGLPPKVGRGRWKFLYQKK